MTRQDRSHTDIHIRTEFIDTLHLDDDDGLNALMVHLQTSLPTEFLVSGSYGQTSHVGAY